jgi:hypothetical protein
MRNLIIFLIRKRLGLKKFEQFQFVGQKSDAVYYFTESSIMKKNVNGTYQASNVSLNWLLHDDCEITHCLTADDLAFMKDEGMIISD